MPTITDDTIYTTNYCTSFTGTTCIERTKIDSLTTQDVKDIGVEIGGIIVVYAIIISLVLYFLKFVIRGVLPSKSRF